MCTKVDARTERLREKHAEETVGSVMRQGSERERGFFCPTILKNVIYLLIQDL